MFSLSISTTFHWSFLFAREFGKYILLAGNIITSNEARALFICQSSFQPHFLQLCFLHHLLHLYKTTFGFLIIYATSFFYVFSLHGIPFHPFLPGEPIQGSPPLGSLSYFIYLFKIKKKILW